MAVLNGDGDCYSSCDLKEGQHAETKTISSIHEPENDTEKEQPTIKTIVQEVSKKENIVVDEGDAIMARYHKQFHTKKEFKEKFSFLERLKMWPYSMCVRQAKRTFANTIATDSKGRIIYGETYYIADSREFRKNAIEYMKYLNKKRKDTSESEKTEIEKIVEENKAKIQNTPNAKSWCR